MAASKLVLIGFHSKKSISFEGLRSECTKNLIFWKIPLLSTLLPLGSLDIKGATLIHLLELDETIDSALMTALKSEATVRRMLAYLSAKTASLKKKLHTHNLLFYTLVLCNLPHLTLGKNVYIISLKLFF